MFSERYLTLDLILVLLCSQVVYSDGSTLLNGMTYFNQINDFTCYKQLGIQYVNALAYSDNEFLDYSVSSIMNAQAQGLEVNIMLAPNGSVNALDVVNEVAKYINSNMFVGVYIYTDRLQLTIAENCEYMQELELYLKTQYPKNEVRIHSYNYDWISKFGGIDQCNKFTQDKVYYLNYNGQQDFDDWSTMYFGGWNAPYEKSDQSPYQMCEQIYVEPAFKFV